MGDFLRLPVDVLRPLPDMELPVLIEDFPVHHREADGVPRPGVDEVPRDVVQGAHLGTVEVDEDEVGLLPFLKIEGVLEPHRAGPAFRRRLEGEEPVEGVCPLEAELLEHSGKAHLVEHVERVVAPGPVRPEGDVILDKRGIIVVPDFLANSGGVIGSYFEWVQDLAGFFWTEEEYNSRLVPIMKDNFKRVWDYAQEHNVKMRRAAFLVAIKRVADELKIKGFFL